MVPMRDNQPCTWENYSALQMLVIASVQKINVGR